MGRIRPLTPDDLPAVVALRQKLFRSSAHASRDALEAYFRTVFLELPWQRGTVPSLVYEDAQGQVEGFLGVIPSRMWMRGRELEVRIPSQFMVDPRHRGMAGYQLMKTLFAGPQDLTFSDVGNVAARRVFESLGGAAVPLYSLAWTRSLRPVSGLLDVLGNRPVARVVRWIARPLARVADAVAVRARAGAVARYQPTAVEEPLEVAVMVAELPRLVGDEGPRPLYQPSTLQWQLEHLAEKEARLGTLQRVLLRDAGGSVFGWFIYFARPGATARVVQVVAAPPPGRAGAVLDHLAHHAWQRGATSLSARVEPRFLPALGGAPYSLNREGPWLLAHSRQRDVMAALHRGAAFVSRLEGEWWLGF